MLPSGVRILLCTEPQDMRRSFDGLALVAQQVLGEDPQGAPSWSSSGSGRRG